MSSAALEDILKTQLADLLAIPIQEIDANAAFDRYGLDSAAVVSLSDKLTRMLSKPIDPILFYENPSITALSRRIAAEAGAA